MPKVSVIVPAFQRASSIQRAIQSVRGQTFIDWELLVVDDDSHDGTVAVVESISEPRLRLLRHSDNQGPAAARNTGLHSATGDFVAFLDSDDEWLPEKLSRQLDFCTENHLDAAACGYLVEENGKEWVFEHPAVSDWREHLHFQCMVRAGSTLIVKRQRALDAGGFDPALRYYEDWDFLLRVIQQATFAVIPEPLVRIYSQGARKGISADTSVHRFLEKHDADFRRIGPEHRRRVRSQHLENLAVWAFADRQYGRACSRLLQSCAANPWRNPLRLAALGLAPIDALFGTSLIQRASEWQRKRSRKSTATPPAP